MTKAETMFDFFTLYKIFWSSSWLLKLWVLAGTTAVSYIAISNLFRRLNDINGYINKKQQILFASLWAVGAYAFALPLYIMLPFSLINTILFLYLIIKEGKITKNYPADLRKEFNWGAFFGTWIWGLFNNSYKTLWIWILGWTPVGFYYQLLCGLKGNEWAYKNKYWKSDEDFKLSQEKQAITFSILYLIVLPVIIFVITIAIVFSIAFRAVNETKTSPNKESKTMDKLEKFVNYYSSLYFESHTITATENKFYVLPEDWNRYSFSEKKDILDIAATTAATERGKNVKSSSKTKELPRTKIYSSTNGELLGEFVMDNALFERDKPDFKEIIKASMKAYRFYNVYQ